MRQYRPIINFSHGSALIEVEEYDTEEEAARAARGELPKPGITIRREWRPPPWIVPPPNCIERLFGVTWLWKVDRAVKKAWRWCRRENARACGRDTCMEWLAERIRRRARR